MDVLMLGWEFPPHISGGLGTACAALTGSLGAAGVNVTFALPRLRGGESAPRGRLVGVLDGSECASHLGAIDSEGSPIYLEGEAHFAYSTSLARRDRFCEILSSSECDEEERVRDLLLHAEAVRAIESEPCDLAAAVERYTAATLLRFRGERFDLIHAHDWMTIPAGLALRAETGVPLVVHIHSLESDRSGATRNEHIHGVEGMGVRLADRVIAVSHYTASVIQREHGIAPTSVSVVHNGVYPRPAVREYRARHRGSKNVLFLGRVTFQKGPDYFIEAAARVLTYLPDTRFVVAGAGDMLPQLRARVQELGIAESVLFPGFVRGRDVEEAFATADLYVMPSVSEPFGISALEALAADVPVIVSRHAGVGEVLRHALKVDFWDVERLADLIVNALLHPELGADMVGMARHEISTLRWSAAAIKTLGVYREITGGQPRGRPPG